MLKYLITLLAISSLGWKSFSLSSQPVIAQVAESDAIPTNIWNSGKLPSWENITFASMPSIEESGSFSAPRSVVNQLGYDPSRTWIAGQTPDEYMRLGDFQDSFELQKFTLNEISSITGLDLNNVSLGEFKILELQTIGSLIKAIPSVGKLSLSNVVPILDLVNSHLSRRINPNMTVAQLLRQSPNLGNLEFKSLVMDKYNVSAIPNLTDTPIHDFKDWQEVEIIGIPTLNQIPFNRFPNPITAVGETFAKFDIAFGQEEQQRLRTVSGSDKEGFAVPCLKNCAHVELSGSTNVLGKAWISGKYQLVQGGKGILASVNDGEEPTGRHPFGSAFKVAVWDVSEVNGRMSQALFFRICMRRLHIDLGCTPYFIGPVPFMSYRERESIFLGNG